MNSSERYTTFYFIFFWWLTWVAILWQAPLKEYSFVEHDHFLSHPMRSWPLLWGEIRSACVSAAVSSCGNRTRLRRSPQWSPPFHLGPQEVLARCTDGLAPETEINKQSNKLKMNIKDSKHKKKQHNLAVTSIFSFSSTKKASPLSPSFMCRSTDSPFISMSTYSHSKQRAHHRDNRKSIHAEIEMTQIFQNTNNFLLGAQHAELAEADVKWGTLERPIGLSHYDDINPSCEGGGVEAAVQLLYRHKHRLC